MVPLPYTSYTVFAPLSNLVHGFIARALRQAALDGRMRPSHGSDSEQ